MKTHSEMILDQEFVFDHRRSIYWSQRKILIMTDLHWGKTSFFQKHGIAVPDDILDADLKRLTELLVDYKPTNVLILGDLIHHERSLSGELIEKIARFRHEYPYEFILVKGNHDRFTIFPETWAIVEEKKLIIDQFSFVHEFNKKDKNFQFSGHIHPMMTFKSGPDLIRLPAFILKEKSCLLPAFSEFTGGISLKIGEDEKAIVVFNDGLDVIQI